jgi:hypothetical protein
MTPAFGSIAAAAPALAMLGALACLIGGGYLIATRRDLTKGVLMLVMAAVLVGNVLIWVA